VRVLRERLAERLAEREMEDGAERAHGTDQLGHERGGRDGADATRRP
jgi:hypothetical protein